ncbi:MAG: hypothetical protein D6696_02025 [Acidobacteria bacterium]|nr:MAG: hypothetical protein D6696_02025 [Acidobacteriota bacterium]
MLALLLLGNAAGGGEEPGAAGRWQGEIELPGNALEVIVDLAAGDGGAWGGQITIPAQGLDGFPLSAVEVDGRSVSFRMEGVAGQPAFAGQLAEDGQSIEGEFSQGAGRVRFRLARRGDTDFVPAAPATATPELAALAGTWRGQLDVPGQTLRLELRVAVGDGGVLDARFGSPDQGNTDMRVSRLERDGRKVTVNLDYLNARFEGTLNEDGTTITGDWHQGGGTLPLTLTRDPDDATE